MSNEPPEPIKLNIGCKRKHSNKTIFDTSTQNLEDIAIKLPVNDFLNLNSTEIPQIPDNIMFPEELNKHLQEQIRGLTEKNGTLLRSLSEREAELQMAGDQLQALDEARKREAQQPGPLVGLGRSSDLAASKIVELSKKVRQMGAELETSRTATRVAEARVATLELQRPTTVEQPVANTDSQAEQIKTLGEKLLAANIRLCETRNNCQQLKQELKLAHKALMNEVGENMPLTAGGAGWKGRAQQILGLQQRIAELNDKLKGTTQIDSRGGDNRTTSALREMERERRASQEHTLRELNEKCSNLEEYRRKLDGARARNRILEAELASQKGRTAALLDKGKHDQQLVAVLGTQLRSAEARLKAKETEETRGEAEWTATKNRLEAELVREKSRADQVQNVLNDKERKLERFEQQLQEEGPSTDITHLDLRREGSLERLSCTSEGNSPRTTEHSSNSLMAEYRVLAQAAEGERVRLLELLAVVNRRLDEERREGSTSQQQLRKERQKAARLELKLARLELDLISGCRAAGYKASKQKVDSKVPEEVNNRLELLQEETLALQTRLQCVQREREEDLKAYTNLLNEARQNFVCPKRSTSRTSMAGHP